MSRIIDPLEYLKTNIKNGKKIIREGNYLVFEDGIKLTLDKITALKSTQEEGKHYTIGTLWLFFKESNLKDYHREAQKEELPLIFPNDRDSINNYFKEDKDYGNILDNDIRPQTLIEIGRNKKEENLSIDKLDKLEKDKKIEKYQKLMKQKESELKDPHLAIMDYIYNNEKKSLNRNSLMKPSEGAPTFEHLLSLTKKIFTQEGGLKNTTEVKSFLDELIESNESLGTSKLIIIVPPTFTEGNICDKNAKEFLSNGKYVNINNLTDDQRELFIEENGDNTFGYKIQGKDLSFEICSNVRRFTKKEWKRVVAVFVQGEDWEFRDWPKSENVSTILQKVKGYYLKYNDIPLNSNIKKWNVKILEISRNKRHLDGSLQNKFWSSLSDFLSSPRRR